MFLLFYYNSWFTVVCCHFGWNLWYTAWYFKSKQVCFVSSFCLDKRNFPKAIVLHLHIWCESFCLCFVWITRSCQVRIWPRDNEPLFSGVVCGRAPPRRGNYCCVLRLMKLASFNDFPTQATEHCCPGRISSSRLLDGYQGNNQKERPPKYAVEKSKSESSEIKVKKSRIYFLTFSFLISVPHNRMQSVFRPFEKDVE